MNNISKTRLQIATLALDRMIEQISNQQCFGTPSRNATQCVNYAEHDGGKVVKCAMGALIPPSFLFDNGGDVARTHAACDLSDSAIAGIYHNLRSSIAFTEGGTDFEDYERLAEETRKGFKSFLIATQKLHDNMAARLYAEGESFEWLGLRHQQYLFAVSIVRAHFREWGQFDPYASLTSETTTDHGRKAENTVSRCIGANAASKVLEIFNAGFEFVVSR